MKLPRDVSGEDLVRALATFGYVPTRQVGTHIRLTTTRGGEHHVTIPAHDPIKVGTLAAIVRGVAEHLHIARDDVVRVIKP